MPIKIYEEESYREIEFLCVNKWDLPSQFEELKNWLKSNEATLKKGKYVADIGFDINQNATGGGGVLEADTMNKLSSLGISLYFSEYPNSIPNE